MICLHFLWLSAARNISLETQKLSTGDFFEASQKRRSEPSLNLSQSYRYKHWQNNSTFLKFKEDSLVGERDKLIFRTRPFLNFVKP